MKRKKKASIITIEAADYPLGLFAAEDQFKTAFLVTALWKHKGNVSHTAIALDVTRRTLQMQASALRINTPKIKKESCEWYDEGVHEPEEIKRYVKRKRA